MGHLRTAGHTCPSVQLALMGKHWEDYEGDSD